MPFSEIIMLICLPVLLAGSAFFSGSETALFSLSKHQQKKFKESNSIVAQAITKLTKEYRPLLITLLMGNMFINVLYINLAALLIIQWNRRGVIHSVLATALNIVPLLVIIIFGEVLPKLIAAHSAKQWSIAVALPLWVIHKILSPLRILASVLIVTPLSRLIAPRNSSPALSAKEMQALLTLSEDHGVLNSQEEDLLQQVLKLGWLKAGDLMTPRVDIQAYNIQDPVKILFEIIQQTYLHHIPVYDGEIDNIIGVIFSRQALVRPPVDKKGLRKLIRQVSYIPEQKRADTLLADMRRNGMKLAIVVDEYGGTAGLITIEDITEYLVGNIPGEYETNSNPIVEKLGENCWRARGDLSIGQWYELLQNNSITHTLPIENSINTIGGLVMAGLGRIPTQGEKLQISNLKFTVESITNQRIGNVLIELIEPNDIENYKNKSK